jgi:glycosyltransferase involved in cell wall biosynthesis
MRFNIVVPTYNTEHWIARCINSIQNQSHSDFRCIVYNDASTDSTGDVIDEHFAKFPDARFTVVHNTENRKALHNIVEGFKFLETDKDPESVLMVIDGDDFLFSEASLAIVNNVYREYPVLLTYGNHIHWPTGQTRTNCEPFPEEVVRSNAYRDYKFISSHLRTFKSRIWNSIRDEDLRDVDGTYFKTGWDVSFMIPMLEMAGERHVFIPNALYVYNRWNPLSDDVINSADQGRVDRLIRTRPKYSRIS